MSTISFIQSERGLGESGLIQTDCLKVLFNGTEVKSFDNYLLLHTYGRSLNPREDRACFVAQKLPDGTLPDIDIESDPGKPTLLCVYDIYKHKIVAEIPVSRIPVDLTWDDNGDLPVIGAKKSSSPAGAPIRVFSLSVSEAKREYDEARRHMNTTGTVTADDPMNDPTRLEHYLFYYDPRYVHGTPFEYASKMRNKYYREHGLDVPYGVPDRSDYVIPAELLFFQPLEEIHAAQAHMGSVDGFFTAEDPIYDPTRLEHYLFEHNPYVNTTPPIVYAIHERNEFLRSHGRPVPYKDLDEIDIKAMETLETTPLVSKRPEDMAKKKEQQRKDNNRHVILWSVLFGLFFLVLAAFLIWKGKPGAAGTAISIPMVAFLTSITRITSRYQPAIPGNYNLWRIVVFFVLLFSSATYQVAKGVNRLVEMVFGAEYPGWTFIVVSIPLVTLWGYARVRKGRSADIKEAKKWGWLVPLCASLILGFLMYFIRAIK